MPPGDSRVPRAGDLFYIPAGASHHEDPKSRRYALLVPPDGDKHGIAAYGTRSSAEEVSGLPSAEALPKQSGVYANRLTDPTNFFPAILLPVLDELLKEWQGRIDPAELARIIGVAPSALGFGSGVCTDSGQPAGSLRGRIIRLDPTIAENLCTRWGMVFMAPEYTCHRRTPFLTIVPLVVDAEPDQGRDVLIEGQIDFRILDPYMPEPWDSAILLACEPTTILRKRAIEATSLVIPTKIVAEVDACLGKFLGCAGPTS